MLTDTFIHRSCTTLLIAMTMKDGDSNNEDDNDDEYDNNDYDGNDDNNADYDNDK